MAWHPARCTNRLSIQNGYFTVVINSHPMSVPADYILGQSTHEQERLMLQARIMRPYTDKYFRLAGISPGMRVLDLGAGVGDVSLLVGDIVGPGGFVRGLDRDGLALERARHRAVE